MLGWILYKLCESVSISFHCKPRSEIATKCVRLILNSENYQIVFQSGHTILYPHVQYMRITTF